MAFKVNVLGAGPAGMYVASLLKKAIPDAEIALYEKRKREEGFGGIGYVFIPDLFADLELIDSTISRNLLANSLPWNRNTVITKKGRVIAGNSSWAFQGVLRSSLMSELERVVRERRIPINYDCTVNSDNLTNYQDADLVIITTGVKRFLPDEKAKSFRIIEAESPVFYSWFGSKSRLDTHILSLSKLGSTPFAVNMYPVAKDRSAVVIEVLQEGINDFCSQGSKLGFNLNPQDFSPVRIRASYQPLVGNVLLLGDAACNPYFCTGAGLLTAFHSAKNFVGAVTAQEGTLGERLNCFSQALGRYYSETFESSYDMIDRKAHVLANFDKLSEADQLSLLTRIKLK